VEAGKRDRRLTLKQRSVSSNTLNESVEEFDTLATVWASKLDVSDAERVRSMQVGAEITTRFQILWSEAVSVIDPKDRCVEAGREYEIVGVKEIGRREGIEITACARADRDNLYT